MGVETDRTDDREQLARDQLELMAELRACVLSQERAVIRGELTQVTADLHAQERGQEQRALLPEVWQTVVRPGTGRWIAAESSQERRTRPGVTRLTLRRKPTGTRACRERRSGPKACAAGSGKTRAIW